MKNIRLLLPLVILVSCQKQSINETQKTPTTISSQSKQLEICYTDPAALLRIPVITPDPNRRKFVLPPATGPYSCIYLDFDGETVTNQNWNYGQTIQCAPSGLNSIQMETALEHVRTAYALYNVLVTSSEAEYLAANRYMRIRMIITPTSYWKANVSGIAFNNSITWGDETPAFVFSDRLFYIDQFIGEIAAHEAGHTLSLNHQAVYDANCGLLNSYAPGMIMGNSTNITYGQWTVGTTFTCNTIQDDGLILRTKLGLR
ncbi:MAG: hypothetical protein ABIY51_03730 [Ferruginibacter sp.]